MEDKDKAIAELKQKVQAAEAAAERETARRREMQRSLEEELEDSRILIAKLEDEISTRHAMESKLRMLLESDDCIDDPADTPQQIQLSDMFHQLHRPVGAS